jgi:protein involved in ribonucleotide reduction
MFWEWIKPNIIGNVGVIAGKYKSVKDLLMLNWLVSQSGDTRHFTDQSSFNFIISNNLIKDKIDINSDFALQVGTMTKDLKIENDIIMNGNIPYVLVHQYDRDSQIKEVIYERYN